jgi:hypothetical protein
MGHEGHHPKKEEKQAIHWITVCSKIRIKPRFARRNYQLSHWMEVEPARLLLPATPKAQWQNG